MYAIKCPDRKTGVRTMETGTPFHAVLDLLKMLGTDHNGCMKMNVTVFEFADGDMYHGGLYPDEEKEFINTMNGCTQRPRTTFEVVIDGSVTITPNASGPWLEPGCQKKIAVPEAEP